MASSPPQIPDDAPGAPEPASPVPAPSEKPVADPEGDEAEGAEPPPDEPVWPTD